MKRQIYLDGTPFDIEGEITEKNITPWTVQISAGSREYSDFSQASLREYHDMRGGAGLESETGTETGRFYWSEGVETSIERCVVPGPKINTAGTFGVAPVKIIDFEGSTYGIGHNLIAKWNTGTSAWDSKKANFASPIDAVVFTDSTDSYLVVSSATAATYSIDGTTWNTLTGCKGYLAEFDNRLLGFYGQTVYYSPRDNLDGTWASFNVAADYGTPKSLFSGKLLTTDDPVPYLVSTKGLWAVDFWHQMIYRQEINFPPHTNAGAAGMYWNSYVFGATGPGIKKISPGMAQDIGPDQDDGLPAGYRGYVADMIGLSDWMIFCVNGGSTDKSSIFKRHGTLGGNHQVYSTSAANNAITCIHHSPSSTYTNGRLWWGEGTGIKYCMFPDLGSNVTDISTYEYIQAPVGLIYPICRPLAAITKTALTVKAVTKNCNANRYLTVYYDIDNTGSFTELGSFATSPLPTMLSFASGAGLEFRTIQFKVKPVTNSDTSVPELESLMFSYFTNPVPLRGWEFNVIASQHDAKTLIDALVTIQEKNTLVAFYPSGDNVKGTSYNVKLTQLPKQIHWDMPRHGDEKGLLRVVVEEIFKG